MAGLELVKPPNEMDLMWEAGRLNGASHEMNLMADFILQHNSKFSGDAQAVLKVFFNERIKELTERTAALKAMAP